MSRAITPAVLFAVVLVASPTSPAAAQGESLQSVVGLRVVVQLPMPATKDGVDLDGETGTRDEASYRRRLERFGVSIPQGATEVVTKIKLKGEHIEVHLGGGGYGTFWDEDDTVHVSYPVETRREKRLEERLEDADDRKQRKRLERKLERLREAREIDYQRRLLEAEHVRELKRQRIADRALRKGSRFNVRFPGPVPAWALTPDGLLEALRGHVEPAWPGDSGRDPSVRKGMLASEVEAVLGTPESSRERVEGELRVRSDVYRRDGQRVVAWFVEDVLVRFEVTGA